MNKDKVLEKEDLEITESIKEVSEPYIGERIGKDPSSLIEQITKTKNDLLDKANEKMKNISNLPLPEKIVKEGKVIRKRNKKDYERLWNLFKQTQLEEFEKHLGYGEEGIKKAGIKKFIDAWDWYYDADVSSWKTDRAHILPCVHCHKEFITYELELGLCKKCDKDYDIERFRQTCVANENAEPGISLALRMQFVYDTKFRNNYKIKSLKEQIREAISLDFLDVNNFLMFKSAIEEDRYTNLYCIITKHKSKITERGIRVLATINAGIEEATSSGEAIRKLSLMYFGNGIVEEEAK